MSRIPYASTVESIIYTMICMRSDVAYLLEIVSRNQSDLGEKYWKIAKAILKYLRNTKDQWLIYGDTDLKLVGYINFIFLLDYDDSRSMSGYVFILDGETIY